MNEKHEPKQKKKIIFISNPGILSSFSCFLENCFMLSYVNQSVGEENVYSSSEITRLP